MKAQFADRHVAPEMLVLSAMELALTFGLVLVSLTPSTQSFSVHSLNPALVCATSACFIAFVAGLYRPQVFQHAKRLVLTTILNASLAFPLIWLICKLCGLNTLWPVGYDSFRPIKIFALWSCSVLLIRLVFLLAARCGMFAYRVAILGRSDAPNVLAAIRASRTGFLNVEGVRAADASAKNLHQKGIRALVVTGESSNFVSSIRSEYNRRGIRILSEAEFWERHLQRVDLNSLKIGREIPDSVEKSSIWSSKLQRMFDLAASVSLLAVTLPLMLFIAAIVYLDSPGGIFYRQTRVGLNGAHFTLLKFRSMQSDAESSGPRWAQHKDPRVTRVGLFMRKTRIDELPQLINILRGNMSFIGPRPERPHFVEQLTELIPSYPVRIQVKPGLTGWAQVNYPYGASVEDARAKLSFDLFYVKHRSFLLDLSIILSTVRVVLFQEGAR